MAKAKFAFMTLLFLSTVGPAFQVAFAQRGRLPPGMSTGPSGPTILPIPAGPGVGVPGGVRPSPGFPGTTRPSYGRPFPGNIQPGFLRPSPMQNPVIQPIPTYRPFPSVPGMRPPNGRPPAFNKPNPPTNGRPPAFDKPQRPPGWKPPGQRPPGWRPPYYRPPYVIYLPIYNSAFWSQYRWRWYWDRYDMNWWQWASVSQVQQWYPILGQPVYYDYGYTFLIRGNAVFSSGTQISTRANYVRQLIQQSSAVPRPDRDLLRWLPLGVFALVAKDGNSEDATLFLQLAMTDSGVVAGTLRNTATKMVSEFEGVVDKETQKVALRPVRTTWPIIEAGVFHLTQNESQMLMHYSMEKGQQWTLVRLDQTDSRN